jgi:hypothetical protein
MHHFTLIFSILFGISVWVNINSKSVHCFEAVDAISTSDTVGNALQLSSIVACVSLIRAKLEIKTDFLIQADSVDNAMAGYTIEGKPVLKFNLHFLGFANFICNTPDATVSIVAHEMGHIYCKHRHKGVPQQEELEADYFSGFVMRRLNRPLSGATIALERLVSETASSTHPKKSERIAAVTAGWNNGRNE